MLLYNAITGSTEEAWFDSSARFESDGSDEDFQSVADGMVFSFQFIHSNCSWENDML